MLGLKDNKQLLLLAGGAAIVGVLLLKSKSQSSQGQGKVAGGKAGSVDLQSKEGVLEVLKEMSSSQVQAKKQMKELASEVQAKSLSLSQTCKRCAEMNVSDPLDKYNLSMSSFNQILANYEDDAAVQDAVIQLMGAPKSGVAAATEAAASLTTKKLIDIHNFMVSEFEQLSAASAGCKDVKTLTFAAQAVVAGKTEAQFKVTPEDIESAVLSQQGALANNTEFMEINRKLSQAVSKVMGM
eukprot:gb/GFBE01017314.1/.p1 GENE.gb/GFBE01017314.1/~~gb/GFBE01017314.1/.p1  ORF type:complete len:240 (+),score=100.74 gb/GFBE01017314.1/:1-720(+)